MSDYKKLFYKSQGEIAEAIESIEKILSRLKECMLECENEVISKENKIIHIERNENTLK